jgi:small-conductance mechanosensitive channel
MQEWSSLGLNLGLNLGMIPKGLNVLLMLKILKGVILFFLYWLMAKVIQRLMQKPLQKAIGDHGKVIMSKLLFYTMVIIGGLFSLAYMGVNLKVLLGAAGVLSVGLGFASQTSASNLISGLFLLVERPFLPSDFIRVKDQKRVILNIDLLSTQLRTLDNLYVRIPNETMMKSAIINYTRFPIRRAELQLNVAFDEDISKIEKILQELVDDNVQVLNEPAPLFILNGPTESSLSLRYCFWVKTENYLTVKNQMLAGTLKRFRDEKIVIPFPHRVVMHVNQPDQLKN